VILQGEGDTLLPVTHAQHTTDVVPGAVLRMLPQHGNFSILGELPAVAAGLAL